MLTLLRALEPRLVAILTLEPLTTEITATVFVLRALTLCPITTIAIILAAITIVAVIRATIWPWLIFATGLIVPAWLFVPLVILTLVILALIVLTLMLLPGPVLLGRILTRLQIGLLTHARLDGSAEGIAIHDRAFKLVISVITLIRVDNAANRLLLGLILLLLGGSDQAQIVFCMLEIILRCHRVAGRMGIASKLGVFFSDMSRSTPDLYVRPVRLKRTRQRIGATPIIAAAPHTLVLSWSHQNALAPVVCRLSAGEWLIRFVAWKAVTFVCSDDAQGSPPPCNVEKKRGSDRPERPVRTLCALACRPDNSGNVDRVAQVA